MKYSIVYSSNGGNTRLLADTVLEYLDKNKCSYFGQTDALALEADIIFIGFWTIKGECDSLTSKLLKSLDNQKIVLFGTAGFGLSEEYFNEIINATKKYIPAGAEILNTFMCQGKMKERVLEKYEAMRKENPNNPNIEMMIKNYNMALSHPDSNDLNNLRNIIKNIGDSYGITL